MRTPVGIRSGLGGQGHRTPWSVFCVWASSWPLPNRLWEPEAFRQMSDVIRSGRWWGPHWSGVETCTPTQQGMDGRGREHPGWGGQALDARKGQ